MKWHIICYLIGCAIAFPLGMQRQAKIDAKEIEELTLRTEHYKNETEEHAIKSNRLEYANALLQNSLDSIKLYERKSKAEALAEIERRKATKEWKIFENCLEKAHFN